MHFPTILTTFVSVAAAAAAPKYPGPSGKGPFQLQVIVTAGNLQYSGQFLNPYHTGAGSNALTAGTSQTGSQTYNFSTSTGQITATLGQYPYTFGLKGQVVFPAPKGYNFVGFNVGGSDNHFTFSNAKVGANYLQFGPSFSKDVFAICPVVIYTPGVYVPTLVYRAPDAKRNASCADVRVKAIF